MKSDQIKWNDRYKKDTGRKSASADLDQFSSPIRQGKALDIACGTGRNSLLLAKKGYIVDAVDISNVAIRYADQLHKNIRACCRDLDTWSIPAATYDLIANINYLNRRLFPYIDKGLKPGGRLCFQTFIGKKGDPYCLAKGELARTFNKLDILYYRENKIHPPGRFSVKATLIADKPER